MFKINDRVRLKHDNKGNPSLTVRSEVGGQRFLCISDCGQRMVWAGDHELEMIERNFDLNQAIREVLLSDQFVKTFAGAISSKLQQASVSAEPLKQPSWTPKVGDWVRINKPKSVDDFLSIWMPGMDQYDGQIVEVKEIDGDSIINDDWAYIGKSIIHDELAFLFDWLERAEQPKAPLNSETIPQGYRKLKDSSIEPRDLEDLRWSVSEKRYVELTVDEIVYANRDNFTKRR